MGHAQAAVPETRQGVDVPMMAFQKLADAWDLSTEHQLKLLGSPARSTYFKWKKDGGSLPHDTEERVSHLLAIYKALQILVPDTTQSDAWIKKPNAYFRGVSALDVMLNGQVVDILKVRQYLDVQRGG